MSMMYLEDDEENLGEPETPQDDEEMAEESSRAEAVQNVVQQAQQASKKTAQQTSKKLAAKQGIAKAIYPILIKAIIIILIAIVCIGIIMFLLTMPGMAMQKLKEMFNKLAKGIAIFFGADKTAVQVEDADIYEILDYFENMGFDIKGYGFLSNFAEETEKPKAEKENPKKDQDDYKEIYFDGQNGVFRYNVDDKIAYAKSDFIFQYIMSDNYVYTLKNDNLSTHKPHESGWEKFGHGCLALWERLCRFVAVPTGDWGKGLICVYEEEGGLGKRNNNIYNENVWKKLFNNTNVSIDPERKKLILQKSNFYNRNNPIEYDLTGWTGRYGMPLEFLLSVHMSTMMPDLAYEMSIAFPTQVNILIRKLAGEVHAAYKGNFGLIEYDKLMQGKGEDSEVWQDPGRQQWLDILHDRERFCATDLIEAVTFYLLGGDHAETCICSPTSIEEGWTPTTPGNIITDANGVEVIPRHPEADGLTSNTSITVKAVNLINMEDKDKAKELFKQYFVHSVDHKDAQKPDPVYPPEIIWNVPGYFSICEDCKQHALDAIKAMKAAVDENFAALYPYIADVTDHWFRDVYFVKPDKDIAFVKTDADFEKVLKERWTLYKIYDDETIAELPPDQQEYGRNHMGEYMLYYLDEVDDIDITGDKDDKDEKLDFKLWTDSELKAQEAGIKLSKMPVTLNTENNDDLLDTGWVETGDVWSAYVENVGETHSGYKPAYPEEKNDAVKQKVYADMVTTGNLTQVGEGLRAETNSKIKKMFMQAYYFAYDGSAKTAEDILTYRKAISTENDKEILKYGALSKDDRDKVDSEAKKLHPELYADVDNGNNKDKQVKENLIYRKVDFTKDSLNAFSMLENTHTLDADFIYRDFKELVVELGYFDKTDLTDNSPKLMQWFIPECGSFGWPNKELDNRENYNGAMAHSYGDYQANEKNTMKAIIQKMSPEVTEEDEEKNSPKPDKRINPTPQNMQQINASMDLVGGASKPARTPQQVSKNEFIETTRKMCEEINEMGYDYCVYNRPEDHNDFDDNGRPRIHCDHDVWGNDCILCQTYEESKSMQGKHNLCCATLASWALQNVKVMPDDEHENGAENVANWINSNLDPERIEKGQPLQEGDFLFYNRGHVDIVGKKTSGGFEKYNGGHSVAKNAQAGDGNSSINSVDGSWDYALRIPWGAERDPGIWKGYKGNEAVVSPVTGILLDYGTYEPAKAEKVDPSKEPENNDDKTKVPQDSGDKDENQPNIDYGPEDMGKERLNVDLKEGSINTREEDRNENNPDASVDKKTNKEYEKTYEIYDKVGYAKILVLTPEIYSVFEQSTNNRWSNHYLGDDRAIEATDIKDKSLVRVKQIPSAATESGIKNAHFFEEKLDNLEQIDDKHENWSAIDKTIYGYKEFAETYDKYGIAGYEIYLDGFVCETPDADLAAKAEEDGKDFEMYKEIPQGKPLTMDTFKISQSNIISAEYSGDKDDDSSLLSMYLPDKERQLIYKSATDQLEAEQSVKAEASPALCVDNVLKDSSDDAKLKGLDKLILIKEGTVLGRTMTDKELMEKVRTYPDDPADYDKTFDYYRVPEDQKQQPKVDPKTNKKVEEENLDQVMGNYIRCTMRDESGEKVEHVEDYFILDECKKETECDWELFFWLPFESGPCDGEGCGPESQGTCSTGETAVGIIQWTVLVSSNMNNIANQFIPGCLEEDPSLCAPLANFKDWSCQQFWDDYKGSKQFQQCLKQICETDRDGFLHVQMEVAKKQYLDDIINTYPWLEDRPSCVQGAVMHLKVWGANYSWLGSYKNRSDEDIIKRVRTTIANTGSTAGDASHNEGAGRAFNEPQIALEILSGAMSEEDTEQWVRTKDVKYLSFTTR